MSRSESSGADLPCLVSVVLEPLPPEKAVRDFVLRSHRIAVAYLRHKTLTGSFDPGRLGLTVEDFAYDSIADLFRRDESEEFHVLARAFEQFRPLAAADPELVGQHLRRVVFTSVTRHIYRSYRDTDPSLAKIIRNIKQGAKNHPHAQLVEVKGECMLMPRGNGHAGDDRPLLPPELMAPDILRRIGPNATTTAMLTAIAETLGEQEEYARMAPVVGIALMLRSAFAWGAAMEDAVHLSDGLSEDDCERLLRPSIEAVMKRARSYMERGRLCAEEVAAYEKTLSDIVREELAEGETGDAPFYEIMKRHIPGMEKCVYLKKHRPILEYLARVLRRDLRRVVGQELPGLRGNRDVTIRE